MPPRLPQVRIGLVNRLNRLRSSQICPICTISTSSNTTKRKSTSLRFDSNRIRTRHQLPRYQSSLANGAVLDTATPYRPKEPRAQLRDALLELQKQAGSYVNISRLQLALRGLDQETGNETIRIAVFGLQHNGETSGKAREFVRALLADPLKEEEEWERILLEDTGEKPILLRVGGDGIEETGQNRMVKELRISWPKMNEHNLEILVLGLDGQGAGNTIDDSVLVPTMDIPTSSSGRYTPVTTPVHKAIILGNGILGAATLMEFDGDRRLIYPVADVSLREGEEKSILPFQVVNISQAIDAITSFREDVSNAISYERGWFSSGLSDVASWFEQSMVAPGSIKQPVRDLISSVLEDTRSKVDSEHASRLTGALSAKLSSAERNKLQSKLSQWAEQSHTELRDELDIAFKGRRWRKLGWWKLFWRVDDVSMITSEILNHRFLTNAEKEVIFLSGRFDESLGDVPLTYHKDWAYKDAPEQLGSGPPPPTIQGLIETRDDDLPRTSEVKPWPLHIPATRAILITESIPALQALAQKLVLQTLTTSTFSSALAGLIYISTISTSVYEAGAVAALGIVWSLRRMQGKWEAARRFWEVEVREEGRKAIRGTESLMITVLSQSDSPLEGSVERDVAGKAIDRAEATLGSCK